MERVIYSPRGGASERGSIRNALLALALFASAHSADGHGIAGNRFFVGTLTFDDPFIAGERPVCRSFLRRRMNCR
jgi:hypothetical protein